MLSTILERFGRFYPLMNSTKIFSLKIVCKLLFKSTQAIWSLPRTHTLSTHTLTNIFSLFLIKRITIALLDHLTSTTLCCFNKTSMRMLQTCILRRIARQTLRTTTVVASFKLDSVVSERNKLQFQRSDLPC